MKKLIILIVLLSQVMGMVVAQDTTVFAKTHGRFEVTDSISNVVFSVDYNQYLKDYSAFEDALLTGKHSISNQFYRVFKYGGIQYKDSLHITIIEAKNIDNVYYLSSHEYNILTKKWQYDNQMMMHYVLFILVLILFVFFIKKQLKIIRTIIGGSLLAMIFFSFQSLSRFGSSIILFDLLSIAVGILIAIFLSRTISNYLYQTDKIEDKRNYVFMIYYISFLLPAMTLLFIVSDYEYYIAPAIIYFLIIIACLVSLHRQMKEYRESDDYKERKSKSHIDSWKEYRKRWNRDHLWSE